jgi:hypothetical protein
MATVLQINVALWGMIGCAALKAAQLIQLSADKKFRDGSGSPA